MTQTPPEGGRTPPTGLAGPDQPRADLPPTPSKAMAGWALGLSFALTFEVVQLIAIGLAIAVLIRGRDGHDYGKRMAVAALVVAGLSLFVGLYVGMISAIDKASDAGPTRDEHGRHTGAAQMIVDQLRVGDCVSEYERRRDVAPGVPATGLVTALPCKDPHVLEVYAVVPIDRTEFVGQRSLNAAAARSCVAPFRSYVGLEHRRSGLRIIYYRPTVRSPSILEDKVICLAGYPGDKLMTGSIKGGANLDSPHSGDMASYVTR